MIYKDEYIDYLRGRLELVLSKSFSNGTLIKHSSRIRLCLDRINDISGGVIHSRSSDDQERCLRVLDAICDILSDVHVKGQENINSLVRPFGKPITYKEFVINKREEKLNEIGI